MNDPASQWTQIPKQSPANVILIIIKEENISSKSPQAELLRWHYRLLNCSFTWLHILADLGVIPRKLLKVNLPKCDGWLYGAMTKRPWRTKSANNQGSIREDSSPGESVLFDQMESSTPIFISQLKGKLTKQSYRVATIFLYRHSDLTYVHMHRGFSSKDMV